MDKRLQHRLIGAAVIIALAVIFLPMLLTGGGSTGKISMKMQIPPEPSYSFNGAAQPPATAQTVAVTPVKVIPTPAPTTAAPPVSVSSTARAPSPAAPQSVAPAPTVIEPKITLPPTPVKNTPPAPTRAVGTSTSTSAPSTPPPASTRPKSAITPHVTPPAAPPPAQNRVTALGKPVTPAWVVQVASFTQESAAIALRDRLRKDGFSAYLDRFYDTARKTQYYRVRVGPRLAYAEAQKQLKKIAQAVRLKGLVVPYR
ncbi:SPOR domain-containing protein [Acidihalobacter ferrooxydans]|uniref:SPOR domain-containing protein n=1 Tax=Acidihalobacter ferrooxydans TaxID=1765967 RepID=A0A1P8UGL6_9GAMM|nr:SPOR domain-containing protein [Acidihalobacter ferrooxydans]APZ42950.1 hypothetical protein BW247_07470 [Acidihalobacter ferrooxydans]